MVYSINPQTMLDACHYPPQNKNTLVAEVRHEGIVDVRFGLSGRWGHSQFFGLTNHHHLSVLVLNRRFQVPSFHSSVD